MRRVQNHKQYADILCGWPQPDLSAACSLSIEDALAEVEDWLGQIRKLMM